MSQTAGFKQDLYDLAYTRHMHDEFIRLITFARCIGRSGCYGPEIRQDIHVYIPPR